MARESYSAYAAKNGYGLTRRQMIYWARKHQEAGATGDTETVQWIEDLLTDINYHTECSLFAQGKYDEAINLLYPKVKSHRNYGKLFNYKGYTFIPYGRKKDKTMNGISQMGALRIQDYNYNEFYKASGNSEADIFVIYGGDGRLFIPTGGTLMTVDKSQVICKCDVPLF